MPLTTKIRGLQIQDLTLKNLQIAVDAGIELSKLEKSVIPADGSVELSEDWDLGGIKTITGVIDPVNDTDIANKQWTLSQIGASSTFGEWQNSVISVLLTPPSSPTSGDRYLINGTGTGVWATHSNTIAEYKSSSWSYTVPSTGMFVSADNDSNSIFYYNRSNWIKKALVVTPIKDRFLATEGQTSFILSNTPIVDSVHVYFNGTFMDEGTGNDYTIAGNTITMLFSSILNDKIIVTYLK